MRATFESKEAFTDRVMKAHGFGTVKRVAAPSKPIPERTRSEIVKEQLEREAAYFGKSYAYGPAEKWGWQP